MIELQRSGWEQIKKYPLQLTNYYVCLVLIVIGIFTCSYSLSVATITSNQVIQQIHTDDRQQQLKLLLDDINKLQQLVDQQQPIYQQAYERTLLRSGRLTETHVVAPGRSRLTEVNSSPSEFDVNRPSTVTAYELEQVLADTGLAGLGEAFVLAELNTGINALFLAALAAHESSWGRSQLAQDKHNLFGFGAYDASPYQSAKSFGSKYDCVLYVGKFLREHYIDGQLSRGHTLSDINRKYASDPNWCHKVFAIMIQIDRQIQVAVN